MSPPRPPPINRRRAPPHVKPAALPVAFASPCELIRRTLVIASRTAPFARHARKQRQRCTRHSVMHPMGAASYTWAMGAAIETASLTPKADSPSASPLLHCGK